MMATSCYHNSCSGQGAPCGSVSHFKLETLGKSALGPMKAEAASKDLDINRENVLNHRDKSPRVVFSATAMAVGKRMALFPRGLSLSPGWGWLLDQKHFLVFPE